MKGLTSYVITPQDIGVTYNMIGGLEEVKEMLRQCVTYPLKYPKLYSEGIASEAVKGERFDLFHLIFNIIKM